MTRRRLSVRVYEALLVLLPPEHRRRHGPAQVQLFEDLMSPRRGAIRLWLRALPDLARTLVTLRPGTAVIGHLARLSLVPMSVANAGAGMILVTLAWSTDSVPIHVAGPALAVATQGAATLIWTTRRPGAHSRLRWLVLAGELAAAVVASTAMATALTSPQWAQDPEYGPMTVLVMVLAHAVVGIVATALAGPPSPTEAEIA